MSPAGCSRKKRLPLVGRRSALWRCQMECHEVPGFDQLRPYAASAVGGEGRIIDGLAFVMEGDEAGILDPVRLPLGDGEDHPLRDVAGGIEAEFQTIAEIGRAHV